MKTGMIYRVTNLINNKCYIGQTKKSLKNRIYGHYKHSEDVSRVHKFVNALRKYKKEDWKWEILVENVSQDQLDLLERSYIWGLSTFEFGYNSTTGGDGGFIRSQETKNKISLANKGKPSANKGKVSPYKGIPRTEEVRQKISASHIGIPHPHVGTPHTEEMKKYLSELAKLRPPASQLTREKISLAHSKFCYKITKPNGEIQFIKNLNKFCKENNLVSTHMYRIARTGKWKHKGYKVERIDE